MNTEDKIVSSLATAWFISMLYVYPEITLVLTTIALIIFLSDRFLS